jgi:hypothetical protein
LTDPPHARFFDGSRLRTERQDLGKRCDRRGERPAVRKLAFEAVDEIAVIDLAAVVGWSP